MQTPRWPFAMCVGLLGVLANVTVGQCADITPTSARGDWGEAYEATECAVRLSGPIVPGDLSRLDQVLHSLDPYFTGTFTTSSLCLNSFGGSYDEGIKIARYLLTKQVATIIAANDKCFSACALIFMAGGEIQEVTHYPYRKLHILGQLGFHAPYLIGIPQTQFDANAIAAAYNSGVQAIRDLVRIGKELHVGEGFFPQSLLAEMLSKGPSEAFLIDTVFKAVRADIFLIGGRVPTNVTIPALGNACQNKYANLSIETSLDEPPPAWNGDQKKVQIRGKDYWFPEYLGQGQGFCVVRVPGASTQFAMDRTVEPRLRSTAKDYFADGYYWYLYPPATPISQLQ
jgi:hypothetical protein